jgi:hypothetical protein
VARWADDRVLAAYWAQLYRTLDSVFTAHAGDGTRAVRLALRDSIYGAARRTLVDSIAPLLLTVPPGYAERVRLDNAALVSRRIYLTDLEGFETVYLAAGRDLRRTIASLIAAHRERAR